MKAYLVLCDIGGWGHWSTMAVCDSKATAEKWLKANMHRCLIKYNNAIYSDEDSFDIDEVDFITADKVS